MRRRSIAWVQQIAMAFAGMLLAGATDAQNFPSRPLRMIVPAPPGGPLDSITRPLAESLAVSFGQPVVVDNRAGANGIIAMEACARALPDGYTLCPSTIAMISINPLLYRTLPYQPERDFVPVAALVALEDILVAAPQTRFSDFQDMISFAQANPGSLVWASPGAGSVPHLYLERLRQWKKIEITHVPYKGAAPVVQALVSGEAHLAQIAAGTVLPLLRAGKLKALAASSPILPGVPTLSELGLEARMRSWFGLFAPAKAPSAVTERINRETRKILGNLAFREKWLIPQGLTALDSTPDAFAAFIAQDRETIRSIVQSSGIRVD